MLKLGHHSYVCSPQIRGDMNDIIIGNYSSMAEGCVLDGGFNHNIRMVTTFPLSKLDASLPSNIKCRGNIRIGHDCYIGEGCTIMSGVHIRNGAVIGAGTVVRKDVGTYEIVANTTRRYRFTQPQRSALIEIAWWNWDDERVLANAHLLLSEDIDSFIKNHV